MRGREVALAGACLLALSACATPRAIGQGEIAVLRGAPVAAWPSQADGDDAAFAKAVQTQAISRLTGSGGAKAGADKPAYLIQVGVALAPSAVGVSTAAGTLDDKAWRSRAPAHKRPWTPKGPVRTVTLAVVDAGTGKTVAWSSIRARKGEPAVVAEQLVAALQGARQSASGLSVRG